MIFRLLADAVLILHLAFIVFVVAGGWLALRWAWMPWLHLPAAVWGIVIELSGWICPLTPLENALRASGGEAGYAGGFIAEYLLPLIYPDELTRAVQFVLAGVVIACNLLAYYFVWRCRRSRGS